MMRIISLILISILTFSCSNKVEKKSEKIFNDEFYSLLNELISKQYKHVGVINYETKPVFNKEKVIPLPPWVNDFNMHSINLESLDSIDIKYIYNSIDSTRKIQIDSNRVIIPVINQIRYEELFYNKDRWKVFTQLKKIYGSSCIITVSTPLFNANFNKAVLFIDCICGHLNGGGSCLILEKKNGRWVIIKEEQTWFM
jgi:hypothetical protein